MEFKIYDLNEKKKQRAILKHQKWLTMCSWVMLFLQDKQNPQKKLIWFELKWLRSAVLNASFCCLHFIISCKWKKCEPPASVEPSPDTNLVVLRVLRVRVCMCVGEQTPFHLARAGTSLQSVSFSSSSFRQLPSYACIIPSQGEGFLWTSLCATS